MTTRDDSRKALVDLLGHLLQDPGAASDLVTALDAVYAPAPDTAAQEKVPTS